MLGEEEVNGVDSAGLWKAYGEWPAACARALKARLEVPSVRAPRVVVLAGMGGSGAACDVVSDWLAANSAVPSLVVKDFHLPRWAGKGCLVVVVSLSGETKEMLSVLDEALERGCDVVALSSGGALESACRKKGVPHNRVERLLVPRASLPGMVVTTLRLLDKLGVAECEEELRRLPGALAKVYAGVSPASPEASNPAKQISLRLRRKRAAVFTPATEFSVGSHFRASMNENAKVPVYAGTYPEIFHNEIETASSAAGRAVVLVRQRTEGIHTKRKIARLKSLFSAAGVSVSEVFASGVSVQDLLGLCMVLDMASIYAAVLEGTPPIATPLLDGARKL